MYQGTRGYTTPSPQVARSDSEILDDVLSTLRIDPWVDETGIQVEVNQGVVRLNGEVDLMNEKRAAGDDAWDTPGVIDVYNNLRVRKLERLHRARREPPVPRAGTQAGKPRPRQM